MSKSTIIGPYAGHLITSGCRNTFIGPRAGENETDCNDTVIFTNKDGVETFRSQDAELSKALREDVLPYLSLCEEFSV